jgi:hypothetical protein
MHASVTLPEPGWVGSWSPGIGDPTIGGWITTFLYFATVVQMWRVMRRIDRTSFEWAVWRLLLVCMLALGINKQLDLQTAFTEAGRILAHDQGWYDNRWEVQKLFIAALCGAAVAGCIAIAVMAYFLPRSARLALCGLVVLTAFVLIRASSFHHVDILLGMQTMGLRFNWILEIGGILLVLFAGSWRLAARPAVRHNGAAKDAHLPTLSG